MRRSWHGAACTGRLLSLPGLPGLSKRSHVLTKSEICSLRGDGDSNNSAVSQLTLLSSKHFIPSMTSSLLQETYDASAGPARRGTAEEPSHVNMGGVSHRRARITDDLVPVTDNNTANRGTHPTETFSTPIVGTKTNGVVEPPGGNGCNENASALVKAGVSVLLMFCGQERAQI